jgi:DNA (cytosine-5)-methyltransferase 1
MAEPGTKFALVDLFAGPGGLAEGLSAVVDSDGNRVFQIELSVEKERAAHATLLLRTFLRQFGAQYPSEYYAFLKKGLPEPDWQKLYPEQWKAAENHALQLELGLPETEAVLFERIDRLRSRFGSNTVLIGGPPCQAYSLVGRARNKGIATYVAEEDPKHLLYENYIRILSRLRPAAFVMENVKGMLSSTLNSELIFKRISQDLRQAGDGYTLIALSPRGRGGLDLAADSLHPSDFIVRGEDFGLPQARHRVIIIGIRKGDFDPNPVFKAGLLLAPSRSQVTVQDVLGGMPYLRSGLSQSDSPQQWAEALKDAAKTVSKAISFLPYKEKALFRERIEECVTGLSEAKLAWGRTALRPAGIGVSCPRPLRKWILDSQLDVLPNNETRAHMKADLARYLFASVYADLMHTSPRAADFPEALAPDHKNWNSGKFIDRFRVQLAESPSTTVTSHISKDGHYFIHYDPEQCRSLTVREAARLQTFPDNYLFKGNRTEQYIQVGNAVPPYLAKQIGEAVFKLLLLGKRKKNAAAVTPR